MRTLGGGWWRGGETGARLIRSAPGFNLPRGVRRRPRALGSAALAGVGVCRRRVTDADRIVIDGIACTTLGRTVVDLLRCAPMPRRGRATAGA
ncbi:MAG: hypothetical protein R2755_16845 [Acidimicrobiales bacterium]